MKLLNKVVIVTGGANGIGRACVMNLHNEGALVVVEDIDEINGKIVEGYLEERDVL